MIARLPPSPLAECRQHEELGPHGWLNRQRRRGVNGQAGGIDRQPGSAPNTGSAVKLRQR